MEMERMNTDTSGEEEEKENNERNSRVCASCEKIHESISKWMLPENARGTYLERANCIPPPLFIISISIAELAVFIYYAVWKPQKQWITLDTGVWNSPFIYRPDKREEAWRFISYMLVHAGIQHILGNLFLQLILGIPLEMVHKGHRVSLVYLAGVIGGSLASSVCDPLQALVGASGGVYALIGGYFMNVLVNFREMIPLFGVFRLLLIGVIVGTDMGFALYRRFIAPVNGPQSSGTSLVLQDLLKINGRGSSSDGFASKRFNKLSGPADFKMSNVSSFCLTFPEILIEWKDCYHHMMRISCFFPNTEQKYLLTTSAFSVLLLILPFPCSSGPIPLSGLFCS